MTYGKFLGYRIGNIVNPEHSVDVLNLALDTLRSLGETAMTVVMQPNGEDIPPSEPLQVTVSIRSINAAGTDGAYLILGTTSGAKENSVRIEIDSNPLKPATISVMSRLTPPDDFEAPGGR